MIARLVRAELVKTDDICLSEMAVEVRIRRLRPMEAVVATPVLSSEGSHAVCMDWEEGCGCGEFMGYA